MLKSVCASISLLALSVALTNPALALDCATPADIAALKTAVMQQELMVAALQCREAGAYNRFVIDYRGELQASDATLKAFFARRGGKHGEAGYDTFKTKAANLSALAQARNTRSFCADAHALFVAASAHRGSLMSFVEAQTAATNIGSMCVEPGPTQVLARVEAKPVPAPVPVRVADARPADAAVSAPSDIRPSMPYRREAAPPPPSFSSEVTVPRHSPPAIPYGEQYAAPQTRMAEREEHSVDSRVQAEDSELEYFSAEDDQARLPPAPRYYSPRNRDYQDEYYSPPAYSPRPGWYQRPRYTPGPSYGWYQPDRYWYGR